MEEDLWNQEKKGKCMKVSFAGAWQSSGVDLAMAMAQPSAQKRATVWEMGGASLFSATKKNRESLFQVPVTMELLPFPTCL